MKKIAFLAGIPCDPKDRDDMPYSPPHGSIDVTCDGCGMDVWIGPQQKQLREDKQMGVLCPHCTAKLPLRPTDKMFHIKLADPSRDN